MTDQMMEEEEQARKEAMQMTRGRGPQSRLRYLFSRNDIPEDVKERFWAYSDPRNLRLSNIKNFKNFNTLIAQLEFDIQLYIDEEGDKLTQNKLSWLNQLLFLVRVNLMASTGGEERDMRIINESRFRGKSEYKQEAMGEEE